jgi:hypothetical protein
MLKEKGYDKTRGEIRLKQRLREELEENYIKEGDDIKVNEIWVKVNRNIGKNKNLESVNYQPSFGERKYGVHKKAWVREWEYEIVDDIVAKNKIRRRNEAAERKRKIQQEKAEKALKRSEQLDKISTPIKIETKPKPITIEKPIQKTITISKPNTNSIIIVKPKEITVKKEIIEPIIIQPVKKEPEEVFLIQEAQIYNQAEIKSIEIINTEKETILSEIEENIKSIIEKVTIEKQTEIEISQPIAKTLKK